MRWIMDTKLHLSFLGFIIMSVHVCVCLCGGDEMSFEGNMVTFDINNRVTRQIIPRDRR